MRGASAERLISSPAAEAARQRDGWGYAKAANLRVLTDSIDAAACQWLTTIVRFTTSHPRDIAFYEADGLYFVASEKLRIASSSTMILGGWEPVIVLTSDMRLLGSYAT